MPDERREIQLKRPASHSCSRRFIIYSTRAGRTQEGVYCAGTGNWDSHQTLCRMAAKKPSQGCTPGRVRRYCPRLSESMSLHTSSPVLQRCSSLALQSIKRHEESAVPAALPSRFLQAPASRWSTQVRRRLRRAASPIAESEIAERVDRLDPAAAGAT